MKILVVSKGGDGSGVAQRLALEGHTVSLFIAEERYDGVGRGFEFGDGSVRRVGTWEGRLATHDLVLADCVGWGRQQDLLRASGVPHLGFNTTLDRVEVDRAKGMELFATAGITIPETVEFGSKAEAVALPAEQGWGDGWVIKPSGNLANDTTRTVKEPGLWERACQPLSDHCNGIAQRLVSGIEVSTEGWFNGTRFLQPFNHTFEEKRFLAGGLGCNTGCMGNVVLQAKTGGNRLTRATVEPLAQFLALIGYRGPFDVNAIVTEDEAYALEATSRMGFDAIEALLEALEEPAGEFFMRVASGDDGGLLVSDETAIAVRLTIPPYPFRNPDRSMAGQPVLGITDSNLPHLFLCDMARDGEEYVTAGADGILLKATAMGSTRVGENGKLDLTYNARRRVYRMLDKISVDAKQYRVDIGSRVNNDVAQLRAWGWLGG